MFFFFIRMVQEKICAESGAVFFARVEFFLLNMNSFVSYLMLRVQSGFFYVSFELTAHPSLLPGLLGQIAGWNFRQACIYLVRQDILIRRASANGKSGVMTPSPPSVLWMADVSDICGGVINSWLVKVHHYWSKPEKLWEMRGCSFMGWSYMSRNKK